MYYRRSDRLLVQAPSRETNFKLVTGSEIELQITNLKGYATTKNKTNNI